MFRLDLGDSTRRRKEDKNLDENVLIVPWLELIADLTRILIHLPGLTFDRSTTQFQDSLERCVMSSVTLIGLVDEEFSYPSQHLVSMRTQCRFLVWPYLGLPSVSPSR